MGIYIKGMDFLPEDGTEFIVKKDEYGTWIKPIGHMGFSMRLIEIPEPHGDLIDRDALVKDLTNGIKAGLLLDGYEEYQNINNTDDCVECVKYADAVIEAEGSEDE